jgi:ArsR family transcriptional regulator
VRPVLSSAAATADRVSSAARALSDPVRVRIVELLRERGEPVCQCELTPAFDISQPTLSHHLAKLKREGIVSVERRGRWAFYALEPEGIAPLQTWLSE